MNTNLRGQSNLLLNHLAEIVKGLPELYGTWNYFYRERNWTEHICDVCKVTDKFQQKHWFFVFLSQLDSKLPKLLQKDKWNTNVMFFVLQVQKWPNFHYHPIISLKQGSLFSKAYRLLVQQYFSAGPLPPLLHPLLGEGVHFRVHFWGWGGGGGVGVGEWGGGLLPCLLPGGSTSMFTSGGGGPLLCSLLGGGWVSTSMFTSGGGGSTSVFTSGGGPLPCSLLGGGGPHMTYPIMLLYTAIECPSTSWAKFTWDLPPRVEQTDRQTRVKTLPSHTT